MLRLDRNRVQARQVLQKVCVKAWRSAHGCDTWLALPLTWLSGSAHHGTINSNSLRRHQTAPDTMGTALHDPDGHCGDLLEELLPEGANPLDTLLHPGQTRRLGSCMQVLSRKQQCLAPAFCQRSVACRHDGASGPPVGHRQALGAARAAGPQGRLGPGRRT